MKTATRVTCTVGILGVFACGSTGEHDEPPADLVRPSPNPVRLDVEAFTIAPGEEAYMCQNFDNPFDGKDAGLSRIVTDMSAGAHHVHVFYGSTSASRKLEACSGAEFHPLLHVANRLHEEQQYSPGMAAKVKGNAGLRMQVHYLNTTTDPLRVSVTAQLTQVTDLEAITQWVGQLYFDRVSLAIPPGRGTKVATSCSIPVGYGPIGLIGADSHMHSRGVHFVATTSTGVSLIDTTEWAEPPAAVYDPAVMLDPGDRITWECTYDNPTGHTFTFGESAEANEMCVYLARFYSSPSGDQIECRSAGPEGP